MTINFTVGPVQMFDYTIDCGNNQIPYFRTDEFSNLVKETEYAILNLAKADAGSRTVFLTGSGTAAMEATIINLLDKGDKVLVINGGSFGGRFVDICKVHGVDYDEIKLGYGTNITKSTLYEYETGDYKALLVNADETSTGTFYDLPLLSSFCKEKGMLFIVDAISSFLADPIDVKQLEIDAMIIGSQKALACPPGMSMIVLSREAIGIINNKSTISSFYLDLKRALRDGERGQTPFTPAVGILIQIHDRVSRIVMNGGAEAEIDRVSKLAADFRKKAENLPIKLLSESPSNAVSAYRLDVADANDLFLTIKRESDMWICPNGGELKKTVFRVGHLGNLSFEDNDRLICELQRLLGNQ